MKKDRSKKQPMGDSDTRIYVPEARYSATAIEASRALLAEVTTYRSHIASMFGSEFRSSYRGTVFGIFWNFALPLVPVSVYILLVNLRVFPQYDGLNPAVYIGFNVTIWSFLTGLITRPIQIVKSRNKDAMKTALPISVAVVSSFAQLCFDTLVRLALVAVLVVCFAQWPQPDVFGFVASLLMGVMFCLALGLILSVFNVIVPDVSRVVTIILQYGIFLSGVIFPLSSLGPLAVLEHYNPLNVFITTARDTLFLGTHPPVEVLFGWGFAATFLFLVAMRFFFVMERRIRSIE
jgi:lipopolysaccharide transport system permease protein